MNGYSDVLQVVGAVLLFSLILNSTNRYMLANTQRQVGSELENRAVTIAQDFIDLGRMVPFDEDTSDPPGSFEHPVEETSAAVRSDIKKMNDLHGYGETVEDGQLGDFEVRTQIEYVNQSDEPEEDHPTLHKRITVKVEHEDLGRTITLVYVRTYY